MSERRAQWAFLIADDGSWYWQVQPPGGELTRSEKTFATLTECVSDAKKQGYVVYLDTGERRDVRQRDARTTVVGLSGSEPRPPRD
jgi:hypothetical protein